MRKNFFSYIYRASPTLVLLFVDLQVLAPSVVAEDLLEVEPDHGVEGEMEARRNEADEKPLNQYLQGRSKQYAS